MLKATLSPGGIWGPVGRVENGLSAQHLTRFPRCSESSSYIVYPQNNRTRDGIVSSITHPGEDERCDSGSPADAGRLLSWSAAITSSYPKEKLSSRRISGEVSQVRPGQPLLSRWRRIGRSAIGAARGVFGLCSEWGRGRLDWPAIGLW